jgi:hypothetical protein
MLLEDLPNVLDLHFVLYGMMDAVVDTTRNIEECRTQCRI